MEDHRVKVLLDTNVFVAAYWSGSSASARLIAACIDGRLRAQYSAAVRRETVHILSIAHIRQSYIDSLAPFWDAAEEVEPVPAEDVPVEDPDDRKFLEAALGGQADFLATNDQHLLRVRYIGRTEILTPGSLTKLLGI